MTGSNASEASSTPGDVPLHRVRFSQDVDRNMGRQTQSEGHASPTLTPGTGRPSTPNLTIDIGAAVTSGTQTSPVSAEPSRTSPAISPMAPGVNRSSTLPTSSSGASQGSPLSPTSPRTRDRGYSLRRTLFARSINHQSQNTNAIELGEAGPSAPDTIEQHPSLTATETRKKSADVSISPLEVDLPPRPEPKKKTFGTVALPHYDVWARQRKRGGMAKMVKGHYSKARKFLLRIQEIPPSKNGRHIDLDATRKKSLVDERTGKGYVSNTIRSSRYNAWNFLPRQLFFQFSKLANFYFLCISILQMIPGLSTTGTYTTIVPLLIFVCIAMGKEGYDDYRRYKLDKIENNKKTSVLHAYRPIGDVENLEDQTDAHDMGPRHWAEVKWKDVKIGDIIRLERDNEVPADMVLLHSDGPNGIAYIETMALDGETNLKSKQASPPLAKRCQTTDDIARCNAHIVVEDPNADLYNFEGKVTVEGETLPLTTNEVIYRGSTVRNTSEVIGMVVNTGEECKIRMNANKNPRIKAPSLQYLVNRVVIIIVLFVIALAIFMTVAYQIWADSYEGNAWYLIKARVPFIQVLVSFIIMFNTMIPLSLYVSMEIIKVGQMLLMNDIEMYDPISDTPMEARTTTINEELGQISYIFSDKTGTLTDNSMRFRKMSVAGYAWLHDFDVEKEAKEKAERDTAIRRRRKGKDKVKPNRTGSQSIQTNVDVTGTSQIEDEPRRPGLGRNGSTISQWRSSARPTKDQPELRTEELLQFLQHKPHSMFARKARFFLLSLALCHTCLPELQDNGGIDFQAASPDELALVRAAQDLGYLVINRAAQTITIKTSNPLLSAGGDDAPNSEETYEILDVIEFSSKRKRMSIIVRFPSGKICIFCKGADSMIMQRLKNASLAMQKVSEIDRRASLRKSIEAEHALRRRSEQSPRTSLSRSSFSMGRPSMPRKSLGGGRPSMSGLGRNSMASSRLQPIRDEVDSWLNERESDVELSTVDNPDAYRNSIALSSAEVSLLNDEDYYDEMIDEATVLNESAVFERCFQHVNDFATEGLRTLLYGYRFLDDDEYAGWRKVYQDATTSLVNRQEMIERAGDMIEQNLDLAGATAIEDKLQEGVPDTIDKLRRANIKIWVLTGDKRETAINVGSAARVIKSYSNVTILDHETGDVETKMATALLDISAGRIAHSVVVIDGQTLAEVESNETLSLLFFDLVCQTDSVICCRASPSQKALLVKKIRTKVSHAITLAIGDGANDIAMIQEAHVGIGITGKEGLQAARTSDYSIAQFRFLQRLLLIHGRWNYVRTCKYILGTFWKEAMFYLTTSMYQRYAGYTGTSFYESWSLSMFNTLFTSLPVIFLGIFDRDLQANTLLAVPELYTYGQRNQGFNIKKYVAWMLMAACEAIIIFYMTYGLFGSAIFTLGNDLFGIGQLAFTACVIFINTKML
jgi:phospholipid-translocating ATPase